MIKDFLLSSYVKKYYLALASGVGCKTKSMLGVRLFDLCYH